MRNKKKRYWPRDTRRRPAFDHGTAVAFLNGPAMNLPTATHRLRPTRIQWLLLYIRSLDLTFAVLALAYVAFTLFEEVNARRDLNRQIRVSFDLPSSFPQAIRDGDIVG